ncbi:Zinc finger and SCAN domain-containing protein 29 [Chelonia mydas]|uniref:Zinc finger and SCAN domain-containing protein 29 n=1 Tax=Chelonia mydas TaxID=8469 RepID=M7BR77_CHEMY|nr:Zinc finger and SCAN domain-containing protein 29 [Chelonia mydas]
MQSQNRKRAPAWAKREVLDPIAVWGKESMLSELRSKRRNAKTFQKISEAMRDRGYSRDTTQCLVKLKELRQAYQKTKESNRRSGTESQTCRFYAELHATLGMWGAATTSREEEDDNDELEESTLFSPTTRIFLITLTEISSQPNEAGEGTFLKYNTCYTSKRLMIK